MNIAIRKILTLLISKLIVNGNKQSKNKKMMIIHDLFKDERKILNKLN